MPSSFKPIIFCVATFLNFDIPTVEGLFSDLKKFVTSIQSFNLHKVDPKVLGKVKKLISFENMDPNEV